ncbi:DNA cytosine methyltransferase [Enterococcus faecalis]|uniref:DNA cytosine methyltransferase n=1 Tax=Enterococcus TaxID=1350 RepID=UPI00032F9F00|nr:DNA cytosine methyltransferase [Enterococcus faecalis]EGO2724488.1 DNA cytosine methyltransferase [Enterococcus faecalis]EGO5970817.1 DNA cytosine methyltransferase [Enterococcus faecalis]EHU9671577.1 DNA cytosine methyltransferase [Enterococcus faecalis]EHV0132274.1 DNA cytosine methyltransferase [Enterococcus faecalis]EHV0135253.1 DNA cytosine methyltransferase [Enterococcus faecalis]
MVRGGARPGSGRNPIDGKELKIKVSNDIIEQLDLFFPGKTSQDRIRECLEYGIKKKEDEQHSQLKEKLNVVDLFSGAGGLSRGFMDAGFNVALGIDFDDAALKTFKENHGEAEIMKLDLFNHDNLHFITDYLHEKNFSIDVLVGGPPCQGYSLAGPRNETDKRNSLYEAMVKLAQLTKPKAIVLENVPGLLKLFEGKAAQRIMDDFSDLGYKMQKQILFAPEFGVPQIRKRVFFVGVLPEYGNFTYPTPILDKENFITCEDAINDLPSLENDIGQEISDYSSNPLSVYQEVMRKNSDILFNHVGTQHEQKTIELIAMVPEGKNFRALPAPYNTMFKYNEALTRYHSKKPSLTINTGHRSHFHYKWNRIPTVRESARLQSFPDDFIFYGNKSQQYKQVGNAVPPLLGKAIAQQIQNVLSKEGSKK